MAADHTIAEDVDEDNDDASMLDCRMNSEVSTICTEVLSGASEVCFGAVSTLR